MNAFKGDQDRKTEINVLVEQAIEDHHALERLAKYRESDFLSLTGDSVQRLLELLYRQLDG